MSVSPEIVTQSLFTAALFLLFISVPKLVYLAVTYGWRYYVFRNSGKLIKKYVGSLIKQRNIIQGLQKLADDPEQRVVLEVKEWEKFSKDVRDPVLEALASLVIMLWIYPVFPEISVWLIAAFLLIVVVVLSSLILLFFSIRDINRIPLKKETNITKAVE